MLKNLMTSLARRLPRIGPYIAQHERLVRACGFVPPGHFYSPIPPWSEIKQDQDRIFSAEPPREIPGIDLREQEQMVLLEDFCRYYADQPFSAEKKPGNRYYFEKRVVVSSVILASLPRDAECPT